ncbi:MAG TPA: DUF1592 domain-containing protein [Candidatus Acidoferrum sp.]|nr:DUF1592 domain-containing protein [Candidatus Acidoferrum sp.]
MKTTRYFLIGSSLLATSLLGAGCALAADAPGDAKAFHAVEGQWGLFKQYCTVCHNADDWAGSIDFDSMTPESVAQNPKVFEAAMHKLRGRLMPPPTAKNRPDEKTLNAFVGTMENYLDSLAGPNSNPGHIAVHRLNRKEYQNAVEDLLAYKIDAESLLPPDTASDGFDNLANVLQVSPTFLEQYLQAARAISIDAIGSADTPPDVASFEAPSLATQYRHVDGLPLGTRGGFAAKHYFPADGDYEFNVEIASQEGSLQRSYPTWWLESKHRFLLTIDGVEVFTDSLGGHDDSEAVDRVQTPAITDIQNRFAKIKVPIKAGDHTIGVSFVARTYAESDRIIEQLSPGEGADNIPVVVSFKAYGPLKAVGMPDVASRRKIFSCHPQNKNEQRACATSILSGIAHQAYRRPVNDADLKPLLAFYDSGEKEAGFEAGIQKGIMAILSSTKFLYRSEPLPADAQPGVPYPVSDIELASRVAYFLWSRGPDAELLGLAEQNQLHEPAVLRQQVTRMLNDPRAKSMTDNFAWQWLRIKDMNTVVPDPRIFSEFDEDLRNSFKQELAMFVDSVLRSDQSVMTLLNGNYSFLDERLARHYGVDSVRGAQFRRVELKDERRFGLLGKGGLLLLTSYPNRTSVVLRGAYVLDTIVGTPPSAPPPGVEINLDNKAPGEAPKTVRMKMEEHRKQPTCNNCHGVIDPIGLALENFNAIGQWRDLDRDAHLPIDAAGTLASGQPVNGPVDLRKALASRPDQFVQALTEKLMTFALGRKVEYYDMPIVRSVVRQAAKNGYRFDSIVQGIIDSPAFRMKSLPTGETETNKGKLTQN